MPYHDNQGFQTTLLSQCQPGTLVLTSGGRLARHLKHKYREGQIAANKRGWISPDVLSLNAWIRKTWNMTWPSTRPLSHLNCLHLWKEASSRVPPPEPFLPDLGLFQALDDTYTVLIRHSLSPEGPKAPATPLLSWRREIMQTFEALARDLKGFHPALLPVRIAQAIRRGEVRLPEAIVLAAFVAPAPIEEKLFDCLASLCAVRRLDLPTGAPGKTERVVMASRKQEVAWLTRQLVMDAHTIPLNRIGVVVPDTEKYVPYVRQAFREIMGESVDQAQSAYNISLGTPLLERPLVQSGLLPLRFWAEGQPRTLLLSLVLSTYYGRWQKSRDLIARADRVWRKHGLDAGLHTCLQALSSQSPELFSQLNSGDPTLEHALGAFGQKSHRAGSGWVRTLETFWTAVGFPVTADEADTGGWRHLRTLLHRVQEDLRGTPMTLADFTGLLHHLLSEELVHIRGSEEAGIQVLGIIESRGLSFEKLYVLGLSAGSLPQPVRPLHFLDVWERHQEQGATAESQYVFAEGAFRHILACAPHVTLIRPEEESAEPLAPSPFWAKAVAEETHREVDPWNAPDSVWARATWLKQAKKGLAHPVVFPPDDPSVEGHLLPENIRAAMEALLMACSDEALSSDTGKTQQTVEDNLGRHSRAMERRRWLGDKDGAPGLLTQWLDLELQRLDEGWCWLCEESSFEGLTVPGLPFSIGGRIDRIDGHKDKGVILWDYKSGEPPSAQAVLEYLVDPQIPAYVLAAKEHRIAGVGKELGQDTRVSGGYILLKKTSSVSHRVLKPKEESWDQVLQEWKEAVARLGQKLVSGEFGAEPYPVSGGARQENACLYCPYRPLCNRNEFIC